MNKIKDFCTNFIGSLSDKNGSHSLKKWIAIAITAVYIVTSIRFTDKDNLASTLIIHSSLITALIITHAVAKANNPSTENQPPA
jgi:hypothetical protein